MICAICLSGATQDGARVLHGKAICAACVAELTREDAAGAAGLAGGGRDGLSECGGGPGTGETPRGSDVLATLNAELVRLNVAEEDLGPGNGIVAREHGVRFQLTDGVSTVVAEGETLLERLRWLPDGAGEQATWWVLADL